MARTFPSSGVSPIDGYSSNCDRPLAYFKFENSAAVTDYPKVMEVIWDVSADATYPTGISVDIEATNDPTIWMARGIAIGMGDCGSACDDIVGLDIGMTQGSNSPGYRHAFCRFRNHSAGAQPQALFLLEGSGMADYFIEQEIETSAPIVPNTSNSTDRTHRIAVKIGANTGYISIFSS